MPSTDDPLNDFVLEYENADTARDEGNHNRERQPSARKHVCNPRPKASERKRASDYLHDQLHCCLLRIPALTTSDLHSRLKIELSGAGGPARLHWQLTWPARVRSSDLVSDFIGERR